ncbi:hypothetical protein BHE90_014064, partial [Fusarium euwallaceae]
MGGWMDGCLDAVAPTGANCETSATLASCSWGWDALERRHPWPPRDWPVTACSSIEEWVLGEDSPFFQAADLDGCPALEPALP